MKTIIKAKEYKKYFKTREEEDYIRIENLDLYEIINKDLLKEEIKTIVEKFFSTLEIESTSTININDKTIDIFIETSNNAFIIGKNGKNINKFINVIKDQLEFNISKNLIYKIDIGDYNRKKEKELIDYINIILEEIEKTSNSIVLCGLNSYERRIIHSEVAKTDDFKTESFDDENERKLKISKK